MKKLLVMLCFLVAACAQPLSQQINNGYEQAQLYASRTELLIDAGAISKEEAQRRLDLVKQARIALGSSQVALTACGDARDCATAQQKFAAAEAILTQLEAIYLIKGTK